ncbi:MAG: glycosyltransferase family 4 protein [Phenylobacterium sp.]|nr:glycosyltransferase family 4 protein [Phenylobacterium sp.]
MRIAQVSPLYEAVPPRFYGGTERVVAHLTDALVDLGHEVTLFASAEARTKARLIPVRDEAIRLDPSPLKSDLAAHMNALAQVRAMADDFDLIHFHTDMIHFPFFGDMAHRTLTTLHGRLDLKDLAGVYDQWRDFPLVSISDHQRLPLPGANWAGTVHHGMDEGLYRFHPEPGRYLAFLGRISPEKRPDRAIEIAIGAGVPLRIAAKIDAADKDYYEGRIRPLMDHPLVTYVGEIGDVEKSAFLGGAQALLFPIDWPEPFGLVMIEAMACGAPVIAYDCGSVPEVLEPGVTGLIVRSQAQAIAAVAQTARYDRAAIRARFEARFSARAMAQRYLDLHAVRAATRTLAPTAPDLTLAASA